MIKKKNKQRPNQKLSSVKEKEPDFQPVLSEPKLIWPNFYSCYGGFHEIERDSFQYPEIQNICRNRNIFDKYKQSSDDGYLGSSEFWLAFRQCTDIFILDRKFDEFCLKRILYEINRLSGQHDSKYKNVKIFMDESNRSRIAELASKTSQNIEVYHFAYFPIHDRFVLMDNEIWHCGATFGGMHASVNALSRGWADINGRMLQFIQALIQENQKRTRY
jgi:hypothetical protein